MVRRQVLDLLKHLEESLGENDAVDGDGLVAKVYECAAGLAFPQRRLASP
jgi:hypothetical protein